MNIEECGRRVGDLWRAGSIEGGIRGILARVVIFHWNRIGLQVRQQSFPGRYSSGRVLR
ncbi:hypothetical protein NBCG_02946 [Nocardioidaceae bacterium Broad-1]|nr:hypothetical protein NBCG_02946 [Nocardioidaceae bacterium Broad-1]